MPTPTPPSPPMIMANTPSVEGKSIVDYYGIVFAEAFGVSPVLDPMPESEVLKDTSQAVLQKIQIKAEALGANAIVGLKSECETFPGGSLLVSVSGNAVKLA